MIRRELKSLLLLALLWVSSSTVWAQSPQTKYLRQALAAATSDTARVLLLADLSATYRYSHFDSVQQYARKGLLLAQQLGYTKGQGRCLSRIGILLSERGNLPQALRIDLQALRLNEASHDTEGTARTLNQTGLLYYALEDFVPSLRYYFRARRLYEQAQVKDTSQLISVLTNIGASYEGQGQLDSASLFLNQAWQLTRRSTSVHQSCWGNPAPYVLRELGLLQVALGHPDAALAYYRRSAQAAGPENDLRSACRAYQYMADLYQTRQEPDSCTYYARKALQLGQSLPFIIGVVRTSSLLTDIFRSRNQPDSTLKYMSIMLMAQDSLYNPHRIKQLDAIGFAEQQRLRQLEDEQIQYRASARTVGLLVGVSVLLILLTLMLRHNRQQQRTNQRLLTLNGRVTQQADELKVQRDSLVRTLKELKITQGQLMLREKMASLGELMAGVAYEIQHPVNNVRKFAAISVELCKEVRGELGKGKISTYDQEVMDEMLQNLGQNQEKIMHYSQRAESIVRGMQEYSQDGNSPRQPTNLNMLAEEYLRLTYHDLRAKHHMFNCALLLYPDPAVGWVEVTRQEVGRALVGVFTTALYAVQQRQTMGEEDYVPQVSLTTTRTRQGVEIRFRDNGVGFSEAALKNLFQRFPTGETPNDNSLGLALSYDLITKRLMGTLKVLPQKDEYTEYQIFLPLQAL
ncbi:Histidine kinase-, DNA gyrase B-, and HSP90-like ATPase [Hymenobacter gelipurpurascens]|uniref:Histidine kinase-, DNA gyrase B-, and HSP90-like ATPase n=1 Tax=Hymenobacter gelipurpurascens TaxID=89968 RepID=A0A212TAA4_9BACT|nr:tetratricopeptide repeat protein [Hymenobacter gelipurpurascens]SNC62969.1 Histidine kinase-, DNA gyrase B-, and HSP90-like ATPase [Hymenobacter gelipurpurascens]